MAQVSRYCLGIDFGGTNTKFCLLDSKLMPVEIYQLRTPSSKDDIISQMVCGAQKLVTDHGLQAGELLGVGIGSPGPLDLENGIILATPNIPGMEDVPIRDAVSEGLNLPAVLDNDANAAAYGEYIYGAGKGARSMVLLTLGTGLGSGIIVDGKVLHGAHNIGAELGHTVVEPAGELCGCGQRGCLERYCSATYIAHRARRMVKDEGRGGLLAATLGQTGSITTKEIVEAVLAKDELAEEVWDRGAYYIAIGCVNVCRIFDPDRILLAGGMTKAGDHLLVPVSKHFAALHWSLTDIMTEIGIAALGSDAGVIGAAGLAWAAFGPDRTGR